MNIELLLKVKAHILEEPNRLNMRSWLLRVGGVYANWVFDKEIRHFGNCGTTACIAGWAAILGEPKKRVTIMDAEDCAIELLDIRDDDAEKLFFVDDWPRDLRVAWQNTKPNAFAARARIAAKRIDRFIAEHSPAK
jgi:hypothetical protein